MAESEPEPELISKLWRELESMTFAASVEALDGSKMPVCLACKQNALPDIESGSSETQGQITALTVILFVMPALVHSPITANDLAGLLGKHGKQGKSCLCLDLVPLRCDAVKQNQANMR